MRIKLKFGEYDCILRKEQYQNGRTALQLSLRDGEPLCVATVNIPEVPIGPDTIFIKDWSENEGVLDSLIDNKVVVDTGETISTGFVQANVCRLLPENNWRK